MKVESNNSNLCYIGVGSNLGNKLENINKSIELLKENTKIEFCKISPIYQTKAVDMENAPDFYNCVFEIKTSETPDCLLSICKNIELKMGRDTTLVMQPRIIDLDILTYGNLTIKTENLIIPHLYMHERLFVLAPLKDLSPDLIHPVLKVEISTLFKNFPLTNKIRQLNYFYENVDSFRYYE
jgi:2-amino-4-hydroxy-6-hydroxymethyldihydropteridine diphosphokinase